MLEGKISCTVPGGVAGPQSPLDGDLLDDDAYEGVDASALPPENITAESIGLPLTHNQIRRRVISGVNFGR